MKLDRLTGTLTAATLIAMTGMAYGQNSSTNQSAAQIKAQMDQLRQQMNQKMNNLQQQLETMQKKNAETQDSIIANNKSANAKASANKTALEELKNTKLSGLVELQYVNQFDSKISRDHLGDTDLNHFGLSIDGEVKNFIYSANYRFYPYARLLHYGWLGYKFSDTDNVKVGLQQVPFGNMPYGYMAYYGGIPYYFGFNDNQKVGVNYSHAGNWDVDLAYFKDSQFGTTPDHYGSNPVPDSVPGDGETADGQYNQAINQGNARLGYTFGKDTDYSTNIAVSGQGGQFYNNVTHDNGTDWAAAVSANGIYGNFQGMLQATAYEYNPKNPAGVSNDLVQFGSFAATYLAPAKGQLYQASAGYTVPINWGILESVTISDDFSYLHPGSGIQYSVNGDQNTDDPISNDFGAYWSASPFFAWTDIVSGKNFLGFIGNADNDWHHAAYVLVGITF